MVTLGTVRFDFFLSRRGSVAAVAQEVADILTDKGYQVIVQDYDIPLSASFIDKMHEAIKSARDLVILYTRDYETSPYTRKEFTSFEADRLQSAEDRHIIILRCEDAPLRGLLADTVYQDLVGVQEAAERRRRVIAAAERQSLAAPPPPRPFVGVPPRIAAFIGRREQLDQLDAILVRERPAALTQASGRVAVQGLGGIGKTCLAIEYAHRFRRLYAGVWWCPAQTRTDLLTGLAALAASLGAAAPTEADVEKVGKAALHRLAEQRANWLLVYDNVSSPDAIADLLPANGAQVLITSRFSDWRELADEVSLDMLSSDEAIALLQSRAGRSDQQGATLLAHSLGNLPLALDHAAATCRRTQMSFADYSKKACELIAMQPRGALYPRSVAATFQLAIGQAVVECPAADTMMACLAECAPGRVPLALVETSVGDDAARMRALAVLAEVSLIKHDPFDDGAPAISMHRLVQAVAQKDSQTKNRRHAVVTKMVGRLLKLYPTDGFANPQSWTACSQLTPHLLALWRYSSALSLELRNWPDLLNRAGAYLQGRGERAQAVTLLTAALPLFEEFMGIEHVETALCLNNLAQAHHAQGDLAAARPLYERALSIREKLLGWYDPATGRSHNNLALVLYGLGQLEEAFHHFVRALRIRESAVLPGLQVAVHYEVDEEVFLLFAKLADTQPLRKQLLEVAEKLYGPTHPLTEGNLGMLALLLHAQGDLTGALPLYERLLTSQRASTESDYFGSRVTYNLGRLHEDLGEFERARSLLEETTKARERRLGSDHYLTLKALNALARICHKQGDLAHAHYHYELELKTRLRLYGPDDDCTKEVRRCVEDVLKALSDKEGGLAQ